MGSRADLDPPPTGQKTPQTAHETPIHVSSRRSSICLNGDAI